MTAGMLVLVALAAASPGPAVADQASQPGSPAAGLLDAGGYQTCAVVAGGRLHCWGLNASGALGYGNTDNVGDDETPASAGAVDFGPGLTVSDVSLGAYHTCAILNDGTVRCWGYGFNGRLGYGNQEGVLSPASVGPVDIGAGMKALAISAGGAHTCVIRNDGSVLCWGFGFNGQLGYGNQNNLGDISVPGPHPPVDLGGEGARAISAGGLHTCAILLDGTVRCWGDGTNGQLGYGDANNVGDSATDPTPVTDGPVNLGPARTAVAISAGASYTCAILDNGQVRCWGANEAGQLGTGGTASVGLTNLPDASTPVDLGGLRATAIAAGNDHTCAILQNGIVECWGDGAYGELGYGNTNNVGDSRSVAAAGPVDLGPGRTAIAITAGAEHTCALLDNRTVRCWGFGAYGQLGYCSTSNVGDKNLPASAGPVNIAPGDGGTTCASPPTTSPLPSGGAPPPNPLALALRTQGLRAKAFRACLTKADRRRPRAACVIRYRRIPGRVTALTARVISRTKIRLSFDAPGTDGAKPPAARGYLIEQSTRPIRRGRILRGGSALCKSGCRFNVTAVGTKIALTVKDLRPHTTYYYAIAALDNVTGTPGPRSSTGPTRTR